MPVNLTVASVITDADANVVLGRRAGIIVSEAAKFVLCRGVVRVVRYSLYPCGVS